MQLETGAPTAKLKTVFDNNSVLVNAHSLLPQGLHSYSRLSSFEVAGSEIAEVDGGAVTGVREVALVVSEVVMVVREVVLVVREVEAVVSVHTAVAGQSPSLRSVSSSPDSE